MPIINNLQLKDFNAIGATLREKDRPETEIFVKNAVLAQAFITRAWLNRSVIDCAMGQRLFSAVVEQEGARRIATEVWLSFEREALEQSNPAVFKNFGLELNKPEYLKNSKEKAIKKLSERFGKGGDLRAFDFDNAFLRKLDLRQQINAEALTGKSIVNLVLTPDWRIVTGLGEASVYETNIRLHSVYGVPYIPASTIKGVLRHYLTGADPNKIETIFGLGDRDAVNGKPIKGQCVFFDAFPLQSPRIELDVMTPHYPEYYGKGKMPADWQSPIPIHFLTVGQGTPFRFMIGLPNATQASDFGSELEQWLLEALQDNGLGAKTAVGYGAWSKTTGS